MNTLSSWEAQTTELIGLIRQEINEKQKELENLEKALEIYRRRVGVQYSQAVQEIKPKDFKGKTIREILQLIAERNNKTIIVKDAVKLMKEANIFGNPLNADSIVYSILGRSPEFAKVGRGVYRMNGEHKEGKGVRKERIPGLKQAILELKTVNPGMTKKDVGDTLIKRGFDFHGRNPRKAVHMLWINLGYAKKEKQPAIRLLTADEWQKERKPEDLFK